MKRKLYQEIAALVDAYKRCDASGNVEWQDHHRERVDALVSSSLPSGAGFNNGTTLDWNKSSGERLVFNTAYQHMNRGGFYDGWSHHTVIVTPSLVFGFTLCVTGRDRNEIKSYIAESFHYDLSAEVRS